MKRPQYLIVIAVLTVVAVAPWLVVRARHTGKIESALKISDARHSDSATQVGEGNLPLTRLYMADAFDAGHLPEPLAISTVDPDQAAEELAKKIAAKDEQSTPALLTAIQMAGFSVRDAKGDSLLKPIGANQGMAYDAFSVAGLAKLYGEGVRVNFARFCSTLAGTVPGFKDVPLANLLLASIRADAQGDKPQLRFWARLTAALGHQSERPYDLLADDIDPRVIDLDVVQFSLIVKRLAGDSISMSQISQKQIGINQESHPDNVRLREVDEGKATLTNAAFHPNSSPTLAPVALQSSESKFAQSVPTQPEHIPCSADEMTATITDLGALAESVGFTVLADHLKEHGLEGFGTYAGAAAKINAVLMVLRLLLIQSALNVKVTMDEPELERTKSTKPGAVRHLTAAVSIDMGKWQELNCLRMATAAAGGIDFGNLPKNAGGVGVDWILVEGGDTSGIRGIVENVWPILLGEQVETDAIVGLKPPKVGAGNNSYIVHQTADDDGMAYLDVEGTPQKKDLTNLKISPVTKEMAIQIGIKLKNANTPGKLFGEFVDLLGSAAAALSEDPGAPLNVAIEMIYRCHCLKSPVFRFPVKDWEECNGSWSGNIKYTFTAKTVHNSSASFSSSTDSTDATSHLDIQLNLNAKDGQGDPGISRGTFSGMVQEHIFGITRWVNGCSISTEETMSGSGSGDTQAVISPMGDTTYNIGVKEVTVTSEHHRHGTVNGCRVSAPPDENGSGNYSFGMPQVAAELDPTEPDVLRGSKVLPGPVPGISSTVSWNLKQCQ
jgi:hypothetical protein